MDRNEMINQLNVALTRGVDDETLGKLVEVLHGNDTGPDINPALELFTKIHKSNSDGTMAKILIATGDIMQYLQDQVTYISERPYIDVSSVTTAVKTAITAISFAAGQYIATIPANAVHEAAEEAATPAAIHSWFTPSEIFRLMDGDKEFLAQFAENVRNGVHAANYLDISQLNEDAQSWLIRAYNTLKETGKIGDVSDNYHTFTELYDHRAKLFATLCNLHPDLAFKSMAHDIPEFPMYEDMFICGLLTPEGWATYHYDTDPYWDMFKVPVREKAPEFDGHTPADAINRILNFGNDACARRSSMIGSLYRNALTRKLDDLLPNRTPAPESEDDEEYTVLDLNRVFTYLGDRTYCYKIPIAYIRGGIVGQAFYTTGLDAESNVIAFVRLHPDTGLADIEFLPSATDVFGVFPDTLLALYEDSKTTFADIMKAINLYVNTPKNISVDPCYGSSLVHTKIGELLIRKGQLNGERYTSEVDWYWMTTLTELFNAGYSVEQVTAILKAEYAKDKDIWPWVHPDMLDYDVNNPKNI